MRKAFYGTLLIALVLSLFAVVYATAVNRAQASIFVELNCPRTTEGIESTCTSQGDPVCVGGQQMVCRWKQAACACICTVDACWGM